MFTLGIVNAQDTNGQDKIIKNDKTVIECKILEIGVDVIRYKLLQNDDLIVAISVDEVLKIVFSNGKEMMFANPLNDPNLYENDRKNAIKINWVSPVVGYLGFAYEKSLKPGKSIESEIGFIGIGFLEEKTGGVYLATGLKFMKTPDFYTQRTKYAHVLKGSYIKPQLNLSVYSYEYNNYYNSTISDETKVAGAIICHLGKQIVFNNAFLIDYSVGVGYGFESKTTQNSYYYEGERYYHYGFLLTGSDVPLALSAKLKIGLLF